MVRSDDNTIEVDWSGASDDLSGVYGYSLNWTTNPSTLPDTSVDQTTTDCISFPLSTNNSWYLHIRTVDNAGNWNSSAYHIGPFYIDITPPNPPSINESDCGSDWTTHNSPNFTWINPGDSGSGVYSYEGSVNDGSTFSVSSPSHPTWSDGIHTFKVRAVDGTTQRSGWSNVITVKIDTTPPAGSISINDGDTYTSSTSVILTLSAVDGVGSGVVYMCFSNDGFSWTAWESNATSKSWTLTSEDGSKTAYVKYKDYVDLESIIDSDPIVLDATSPTSPSLASPSDGAMLNDPNPTLSWSPASDGTSGISEYTLEIDNSDQFNTAEKRTHSDISGASTSFTIPDPLPPGCWFWRIYARDGAGNPGPFSTTYRLSYGETFLVVRGMDDGIYVRAHTENHYSMWDVIPGYTYSSPAAALCDSALHLAVRGGGDTIWYGNLSLDTGEWNGWLKLPGYTPSSPAITCRPDGSEVYVVVRGSDNGIYLNVLNSGSWEGWRKLPGETHDFPAIALLDNELHIVVKGFAPSMNSVWHGRLNVLTDEFLGWTRVPGWTPSPPDLAPDPANSRLYLTVRGTNDRIYFTYFSPTTGWSPWQAVPNGYTSDGPSITIEENLLRIAVRGSSPEGSMYAKRFNLDTDTWFSWILIPGSTPTIPKIRAS
jgi:hypothetical protein